MKANEMTPEKQKSDVELLSEDEQIFQRNLKLLNSHFGIRGVDLKLKFSSIDMMHVMNAVRVQDSLKYQQLQATVDELKNRCEELEKYAIHKPNCARLQRPFGASVTVCNDNITCTCGLDNLLTPNERK